MPCRLCRIRDGLLRSAFAVVKTSKELAEVPMTPGYAITCSLDRSTNQTRSASPGRSSCSHNCNVDVSLKYPLNAVPAKPPTLPAPSHGRSALALLSPAQNVFLHHQPVIFRSLWLGIPNGEGQQSVCGVMNHRHSLAAWGRAIAQDSSSCASACRSALSALSGASRLGGLHAVRGATTPKPRHAGGLPLY